MFRLLKRLLRLLIRIPLRILRKLYRLSCRWMRRIGRFLYRPWMTWRLYRLMEIATRWIR